MFILKVFEKKSHIEVSAYEGRGPVRSFVEHRVNRKEVETYYQKIIDLFNRSNLKRGMSFSAVKKLQAYGQLLYDELLPPGAKERLSASRAEHLVLDVDDKLNHLPWELLFDGGQFLSLRFSMGRVVRTMDAPPVRLAERKTPFPLKTAIFFDPRGDLGTALSPDEPGEGEVILDFLSRQEKLVVDFKGPPIDSAFVKMRLRDYDLVHYAGHAEYDVRAPENSGWLLSDKRLLSADILQMLGNEKSLPLLVFSNACRSGIAGKWKGTNTYDLAKAFLVSGVQHYIGTLWEIPDRSSAHFALEFYRGLVEGCSVGASLRRARCSLIEKEGPQAVLWGAYVLYGDPSVRYLGAESAGKEGESSLSASKERAVPAAEPPAAAIQTRPHFSKRARMIAGALFFIAIFTWKINGFRSSPFRDASLAPQYEQALAYVEEGDYDAALDLSRALGKSARAKGCGHLILGDIHFSRGDMEKALFEYFDAADGEETPPWAKALAYNRLGRVYALRKEYERALSCYDEALAQNSRDGGVYVDKGVALQKTGDYKEALKHFSRALEIDPHDRKALFFKEEAQRRVDNPERDSRNRRINKLINELVAAYEAKALPPQQPGGDGHLTLAFINFRINSPLSSGEGDNEYIFLKLIEKLNQGTGITVVERYVMESLLRELKLGSSRLADPNVSIKLGRILSARVIVTGNVVREKERLTVGVRLVETESTAIRGAIAETLPQGMSADKTALYLADKIRERLAEPARLKAEAGQRGEGGPREKNKREGGQINPAVRTVDPMAEQIKRRQQYNIWRSQQFKRRRQQYFSSQKNPANSPFFKKLKQGAR